MSAERLQVPYGPPTHLLDVLAVLDFEEALTPDDPRYVETERAGGPKRTLDRLARKFGLLRSDGRFVPPKSRGESVAVAPKLVGVQ